MDLTKLERKDILLPSCYYTLQIDDPQMDKSIIQEIELEGDFFHKRTNVKATMTRVNMFNRPGFDKLVNWYVFETAKVMVHREFAIEPSREVDYGMRDLWGMRYESGDYATPHCHFPSDIAYCYYVNVPSGAPGLYFPDIEEELQVEAGTLVMFWGHMKHEVKQKEYSGYRYAVAGNIDLTL